MADPDKQELKVVVQDEDRGSDGGEEERLLEGMAVLDFDVLCSTVAMQNQGKWRVLDTQDEEDVAGSSGGGEFGGVFRMWEGELLDCFDDHRVALESLCCPCYRFGKNMKRAGFGSPIVQGAVYLMLVILAVVNFFAFTVTRRLQYLYIALVFTISIGLYLGYLRTRIRKKFNIQAGDSYLDDCVYHLVCPCCSLCQESRTLEMNNVQDGAWHGRGDTICIGRSAQSNKAVYELHPPIPMSIQSANPSSIEENKDLAVSQKLLILVNRERLSENRRTALQIDQLS